MRAREAERLETLAAWCDRTLGTEMTSEINRHMIKWCAAFCDEGSGMADAQTGRDVLQSLESGGPV